MISGHVGREDRGAISAAWGGASVYDWYGVADTGIVAAEGPDQDGLYVWEDAHVLEIIDPDSHTPRPAGEAGNMCVTALFKDGVYPIVRFDTNDVSSFLTIASPVASRFAAYGVRGAQRPDGQAARHQRVSDRRQST